MKDTSIALLLIITLAVIIDNVRLRKKLDRERDKFATYLKKFNHH